MIYLVHYGYNVIWISRRKDAIGEWAEKLRNPLGWRVWLEVISGNKA